MDEGRGSGHPRHSTSFRDFGVCYDAAGTSSILVKALLPSAAFVVAHLVAVVDAVIIAIGLARGLCAAVHTPR